jgi:hypothetical protein
MHVRSTVSHLELHVLIPGDSDRAKIVGAEPSDAMSQKRFLRGYKSSQTRNGWL